MIQFKTSSDESYIGKSNLESLDIYKLLSKRYQNKLSKKIIEEFYFLLKTNIFLNTEIKEKIIVNEYSPNQIIELYNFLKNYSTCKGIDNCFTEEIERKKEKSKEEWKNLVEKYNDFSIIKYQCLYIPKIIEIINNWKNI